MDKYIRQAMLTAIIVTKLLAPSAVFAQPEPARLKGLNDLRPGEWRELKDTQMSAVFPRQDQTIWGVIGPRGVVAAWGGAAYDTTRDAFVFNGGGHADYGGNEVYAFFLAERKWVRLTNPSQMRKLESKQYETTDGTPVSAHTYDGLEYLPNVDRVFRNGGSEFPTGGSFDRSAWLFDMSRLRWERRSAGGGGLPTSAYNPTRGSVYIVNSSSVHEYDPVADAWTRKVSGQASFLAHIGALDPENKKLITNSYRHRPGIIVYEIAPDGSMSPRTFPRTQGATEWDKKMLALEYDPRRRMLVAWAGDRETAYLDGKTLVWRRYGNTQSAAAPVKHRDRDFRASGAIYGRWRYVPKYDLFIGYNNPHGNVWVWKPAAVADGDATGPPLEPEPVVSKLLKQLKGGETIVIPPGVYREAAVVSASNVTIKAHGVRLEKVAIQNKAALVIKGNNVTIEGLECSGISVPDRNGACVRLEAKDLTLRAVRFSDSQSGVLSWNRDSGTVLIEHSRFERIGRAHAVYIGRGDTHLIIRNSWIVNSTDEGHEIKSRAARNTIEQSVIASLDGVDSRLIDLPEGGINIIRRNVLQEGPVSSNQDLIGVGLEAHRGMHANNSTVIEDNTIIMERRGTNVLLQERHVPPARIERNKVIGGKSPGGNNAWFRDRAAAGLDKYPALPRPQ